MKDKSEALPPLPKPFMRHWINAPFEDVELFTAEQVRDAQRAALTAAPSAQAEPQAPLTDEQIDALDTFSLGWMAPRSHVSVRAFARAIERAHGIGKQGNK